MNSQPGGDGQPPRAGSATNAESEGSIFERAKAGARTDGADLPAEERAESDRIRREEPHPESLGNTADRIREREARAAARPAAEPLRHGETQRDPSIVLEEQPLDVEIDPAAARRAERLVATYFVLSFVATVLFVIAFFFMDPEESFTWPVIGAVSQTELLGTFFALVLLFTGVGVVLWGKRLMPEEEAVQEREPFHSDPAESAATADAFRRGTLESGIGRRKLLRRTLALPVLGLGVTTLVPLAGVGPAPRRELYSTAWRRGIRLVDEAGRPQRIGDLRVGGYATVFPEGHIHEADVPSLLIRLRPEELNPRPEREDWAVDGHVVYSAICTHAGCPAKLYEQQTHHLLCPCHQSVFLVTEECKPIFGPAARPLPQLAIAVDEEGYFVAQGDYSEPVGVSFWERG